MRASDTMFSSCVHESPVHPCRLKLPHYSQAEGLRPSLGSTLFCQEWLEIFGPHFVKEDGRASSLMNTGARTRATKNHSSLSANRLMALTASERVYPYCLT
jgi:hypothetical protein